MGSESEDVAQATELASIREKPQSQSDGIGLSDLPPLDVVATGSRTFRAGGRASGHKNRHLSHTKHGLKPGISVYILTGRQLFAESLGIALALHPDIEVAGSHCDLRIGLANILRTSPSVVLMDHTQARVNGAQL